jgi:hypothetical protein
MASCSSPPPVTRPLGLVMPPAHAEPVVQFGAAVLGAFRTQSWLRGDLWQARLPPALVVHAAHAPRRGYAIAVIRRALQRNRPTGVGLLLYASCPADVAGPVIPVVVDAVKRVAVDVALSSWNALKRPRADLSLDLGNKGRQVMPGRMNRDAPATVPSVVGRTRVLAAVQHLDPDMVNRVRALTGCEPVPGRFGPPPGLLLGGQAGYQTRSARSALWCLGRHLRRRVITPRATCLPLAVDQLADFRRCFVPAIAPAGSSTPSPGLFRRATGSHVGIDHDEAAEPLASLHENLRRVTIPSIHGMSIRAIGLDSLGMVA